MSLTGNHLAELPGTVSNLTKLRELTITGNELRQLPAELGCVTSLEKVHVDADNQHLRNPPPEIVREGAAAIVEYLKEMYQACVSVSVCLCVRAFV